MFRLGQPREILRCAAGLAGLSQAALLERANELRWRAHSGAALKKLLPEAFALGIEATRRTLLALSSRLSDALLRRETASPTETATPDAPATTEPEPVPGVCA